MHMAQRFLCLAALTPLLGASSLMAEGRWYKGDLHAHSTHSDGDSSVADIITRAEDVGLDYFVITDHDSSMQGETPHWSDPAYTSSKLILLYGVEWTNSVGHANIWAPAPFDYDPMWKANRDLDPWAAAEAAHAAGALFSINHPTNYTCCAWDGDEGMNDGIEVWNSYHRTVTNDSLATRRFWQSALLSGRRPTAVGGSDMHSMKGAAATVFTVGNPTTWVYAFAPTPAGILEGIAEGRVSVSYSPDAPRVELWADGDGNGTFETAMGEEIPEGSRRLQVRLGDAAGTVAALPLAQTREFFAGELSPSSTVRLGRLLKDTACGGTYLVGLYRNGELLSSTRVACGGTWETTVSATTGSFFRLEVLGKTDVSPRNQAVYGNFVGMTNPIFVQ